jgi:hypothetical protein
MLCWMTGTGIVTVAGVAAGVGVGVGVAVAVGVEAPPSPPPLAGEANGLLVPVDFGSDVSRADAAVRVRTAPATATPPAARNCRLVATTDRM